VCVCVVGAEDVFCYHFHKYHVFSNDNMVRCNIIIQKHHTLFFQQRVNNHFHILYIKSVTCSLDAA
jgi:hypothetical protein